MEKTNINLDTNEVMSESVQPKSKHKASLGYLKILLAGMIWGTGGYYVMQMNRLGGAPTITAFTNHIFALIPIAIVLLITRGKEAFKISKQGLIFAIIMGVFTKALFKLAYDTSVSQVGQSTGAVLLYTAPVFIAIMSVVFLKEKIRLTNYVALALNLVGVFLMVTGGNIHELNLQPLGVVLGITAAALHALNTILGRLAGKGDNPLTTSFYMLLSSSIFLLFFAKPWQAETIALLKNGNFLFWALVSSLLTGATANMLYLGGLSHDIDTSKAPIFSSVEVIIAVLMGVVLLNENINWVGIFGIILMVVSILLMNLKKNKTVE